MTETKNNNQWATPLAIIIAGVMIAGAIINSNPSVGNTIAVEDQNAQERVAGAYDPQLDQVMAIGEGDHVRGNKNAPVVVVEYSDLDCPFCERFHNTMNQVVEAYGSEVAWVYRHFPLDSLHPMARTKAVASECVASLGGNTAFWEYIDQLFAGKVGVDRLVSLAGSIGLSETEFASCLESNRFENVVQNQLDNAVATGGRGTPWTIVIAPNGMKYAISGAQSFEAVSAVIDRALTDTDSNQ